MLARSGAAAHAGAACRGCSCSRPSSLRPSPRRAARQRHQHQQQQSGRRRPASLAAAAAAAGDGGGQQDNAAPQGAGQQLQFEVAAPLSSPQGAQLVNVVGEADMLFDQFVTAYLAELKQERKMEQEMEEAAARDAADEAAAASAAADGSAPAPAEGEAASSSSSSSNDGQDASDTWNDAALMRRIKALREAERGQTLIDILYLGVARQLHAQGLALLRDPALLRPGAPQQLPGSFISPTKLARSGLLSAPVIDAVLSYMASTFEGGDGELMRVASPAQTPLNVDRVQAARLYAGLLEFGYFAAALEAACLEAGVAVGQDSSAMIQHADALPEQELRQLCAVKSADAWWGAVRHVGCVFGLRPNDDPFDSFGLPFPDLAVTISQIRMEPAANMWEHFNTPGSAARLAAKAADKAARGWSGQGPDGAELPEADLLTFEFGAFQRLLLEAAVYGAVLFGVERRVEREFDYPLSSRRDREQYAEPPPPLAPDQPSAE